MQCELPHKHQQRQVCLLLYLKLFDPYLLDPSNSSNSRASNVDFYLRVVLCMEGTRPLMIKSIRWTARCLMWHHVSISYHCMIQCFVPPAERNILRKINRLSVPAIHDVSHEMTSSHHIMELYHINRFTVELPGDSMLRRCCSFTVFICRSSFFRCLSVETLVSSLCPLMSRTPVRRMELSPLE